MNLEQQSALVAAIIYLALANYSLVLGRKRTANRVFAGLSFTIFLWILSRLVEGPGSRAVGELALIFLPTLLLHFVVSFIRYPRARYWYYIAASYSASGVLGATLLIQRGEESWRRMVFALFAAAAFGMAIYLLGWRFRRSNSRIERSQLFLLLLGAALAVGTIGIHSLGLFLDQAPPLGILGSLVFALMVGVAIVRAQLMDLSEVLGRAIVVFLTIFFIWLVYLNLGEFWGRSRSVDIFLMALATFLLLAVYDPIRHIVELQAKRVLQRESYLFQSRLTRLAQAMGLVLDLDTLPPLIGETLEAYEKIDSVELYLARHEGDDLVSVRREGSPRPRIDRIESDKPVCVAAREDGLLDQDKIERDLQLWHMEYRRKQLKAAYRTLSLLNADLAFPILSRGEVLGLLFIRLAERRRKLSKRELELIASVASAFGVRIENSRIYAKMKQRDRLAALGEMAAGLAHEVRNPLGAIQAAAQYIKGDGVQPEAEEFVDIILEETGRLNNVVSRFLEFARPMDLRREPTRVDEVILGTLRLLSLPEGESPVSIQTSFDAALPALLLDADQIKQVFMNIILNAIQAMPDGGELQITTRYQPPATEGGDEQGQLDFDVSPQRKGLAIIRFKDAGPGIDAKVLDRIFIPFFTTREKGSGLGLAIGQRIVENHGGTLRAYNAPGGGCAMDVVLPVEPVATPELGGEHEE